MMAPAAKAAHRLQYVGFMSHHSFDEKRFLFKLLATLGTRHPPEFVREAIRASLMVFSDSLRNCNYEE
jgi:hypothetical protein